MSRSTQTEIRDAVQAELETLDDLVAAIQEASRTFTAGRVDWGHVGTLRAVTAELSDLADRLAGTGEYADEA
jgi:hypothetical protein